MFTTERILEEQHYLTAKHKQLLQSVIIIALFKQVHPNDLSGLCIWPIISPFHKWDFWKRPICEDHIFFWMNSTNKIYHRISFPLNIYLSYCWYWLYRFELLRRSVRTNTTRWFYALFVERAKEPQPWGEEPNSLAPPPPRAGQQPAGCGMASHSSTRDFSSRSANAVVSVTPACTAWADPTRGSAGLRSGLLASRSVLSTR